MKEVNGHQIIQLFESWVPKSYALDDDPIGLQIGRATSVDDTVSI